MELLKTKAAVEPLLLSRINAFDAGKILSKLCALEELSEADKMRLIWSNDGFRNKMEKAARLSTEPHIWSGHNFAYAPESACWLQHKLMTAEDLESGEIVGFCEIAMLSQPSDDENENCSLEALPTIVNLVTSPRFRRRGVGSRLMKAAARFVQRQWSCDELTLYVDKSNDAAVAMYENLGFEGRSEAESESRSQSYMTLQLSSTADMGISFS
jgi:ribosomal protein S18 acetylase RimI-like enzyme